MFRSNSIKTAIIALLPFVLLVCLSSIAKAQESVAQESVAQESVAPETGVPEREAQFIEGWGEIIDPDGDCKISEKDGAVTIEIPNTCHDLNQRNGTLNAPRVLRDIEGNFRIEVKVSGKFEPGKEPTAVRSAAFNGAGILLWHDVSSNVRLERNSFGAGGDRRACFPPLFELRHNGKYLGANPPIAEDTYFNSERTSLRIDRLQNVVTAYIRHSDDEKWTRVKSRIVDYPLKLKIGVSAINTSSDPMTVTFHDLKVTENLTHENSAEN